MCHHQVYLYSNGTLRARYFNGPERYPPHIQVLAVHSAARRFSFCFGTCLRTHRNCPSLTSDASRGEGWEPSTGKRQWQLFFCVVWTSRMKLFFSCFFPSSPWGVVPHLKRHFYWLPSHHFEPRAQGLVFEVGVWLSATGLLM